MQPYIIKGYDERQLNERIKVAETRGWEVKQRGDKWMHTYRTYWAEMKRKDTKES